MAEVVYLLCALTSVACAALLLRGYLRSRTRLLLWSTLCFAGLAINNVLLFIDLAIFPHIDLSVIRLWPTAVGVLLLTYGLVWEGR